MSDIRAGSVYFDVIANIAAIKEFQSQLDQVRRDAAAGINIPVFTGQSGSSFSGGGGGGRTSAGGIDRASMLTGMTPGDVTAARMGFESFNPSGGWAAAMASRQRSFQQESLDAMLAQQTAMEEAVGGHAGIGEALRKQMYSEIPLTSQELEEEQIAAMGGLDAISPMAKGPKGRLMNWHTYFMASIGTHLASGAMDAIAGAIDNEHAGARDNNMGGVQGAMARVKGIQADYKLAGQIPLAGQLGAAMANLYDSITGTDAASITSELKQSLQDAAAQSSLLVSRIKEQTSYAAEAAKYEASMGHYTAAASFTMGELGDKYQEEVQAADAAFKKQIAQSTSDQQRLDYSNQLNTTMSSLASVYAMQVTVAQEQLGNAKLIRDNGWKILNQEYASAQSGHPMTREEILRSEIARETKEYAAGKTLHIPAITVPGVKNESLLETARSDREKARSLLQNLPAWDLTSSGMPSNPATMREYMGLMGAAGAASTQYARQAASRTIPAHMDHLAYSAHGRLHEEIMRQTIELDSLEKTSHAKAVAKQARLFHWHVPGEKPADYNYASAINRDHARHHDILQRLQAEDKRRQKVLGDQMARDNEQMIRSYGGSVDNATGLVSGNPLSMAEGLFSHQGKKADKVAEKIDELKKAMAGGLQALAKALGVPVFNVGA